MGEQIKYFINNSMVEFLIDITKIHTFLPFVNYKLSYIINGRCCFASNLKIKAKIKDEEYFFYAHFSIPKDFLKGEKLSFILQQICTDEFKNQTAICRSYPITISKLELQKNLI